MEGFAAWFFQKVSISNHLNKKIKSQIGVTGENLFQGCEAVQEIFLLDPKLCVLVKVCSEC